MEDADQFASLRFLESLLELSSTLLGKSIFLFSFQIQQVLVFFIGSVTATADSGIPSLPTSKQELDAAEEFGPKLPPAFSSGRFCKHLEFKY